MIFWEQRPVLLLSPARAGLCQLSRLIRDSLVPLSLYSIESSAASRRMALILVFHY
jgi:hypothetical protein